MLPSGIAERYRRAPTFTSEQAFKDAVPTAPATSRVNGDVTRRPIPGKRCPYDAPLTLAPALPHRYYADTSPLWAPPSCRLSTTANHLPELVGSSATFYAGPLPSGEIGDAQHAKPLRCMKKAYTLRLMTEPKNVGGVTRQAWKRSLERPHALLSLTSSISLGTSGPGVRGLKSMTVRLSASRFSDTGSSAGATRRRSGWDWIGAVPAAPALQIEVGRNVTRRCPILVWRCLYHASLILAALSSRRFQKLTKPVRHFTNEQQLLWPIEDHAH